MTDFHAKHIAHELTRRCASDSIAAGLLIAQKWAEQKLRVLVNLRKQWSQELADKSNPASCILRVEKGRGGLSQWQSTLE